MSKKNSFNLNMKIMEHKLNNLQKNVMPELLIEGVGKACIQIINDAIFQEPTVPLDEGTLRGSASAHVEDGRGKVLTIFGDGGNTIYFKGIK